MLIFQNYDRMVELEVDKHVKYIVSVEKVFLLNHHKHL